MKEQLNLELLIPEEMAGSRLDQVVAALMPDYSRARLQQWIKEGKILIDAQIRRSKDKVAGGEKVSLKVTLEPDTDWQPEEIDLDIVFEDEALIIINKPAGLVVHPAAGNRQGTLLNALINHAPSLATIPRAGIVHRLDKDTTGIMVIAKSLPAQKKLVDQLQARTVKRQYQAIVAGVMTAGGTVSAPIGRHAVHRTRMAVNSNGKDATTHYRVIKRFRGHTHIDVKLETGRTHQIRVHMAHIKYPIIGDPLYGGRLGMPKGGSEKLRETLRKFRRQALHAYSLTFTHPESGDEMGWEVPLPGDMASLLQVLDADQTEADG
ncbi:MAG: 23S rRNA pseudouridine(1911/1915/1917) synthase RluD [Gammaproteobacteria bacterium]